MTLVMDGPATSTVPALERAWMEAWRTRDRPTCERLLVADFQLTSARGGIMSRDTWLANAFGSFECESLEWEEIVVRPLGAAEDVALIHARVRQEARAQGQDWSGVFLLSDVWVRGPRGWQVVARHGTGPLLAR